MRREDIGRSESRSNGNLLLNRRKLKKTGQGQDVTICQEILGGKLHDNFVRLKLFSLASALFTIRIQWNITDEKSCEQTTLCN